ncbi:cytochrome c3 family protein [Permianibacter aggregans]|uniref:Quinol:cytochrome c oxidoreductase pentaheme cytochrome subunit n=1 Tax=Permianibacter aggregans TaxID=1510150 RepID=A0A4R6UD11_9GAMM|nr:cytochrome c3 family protein [Permianibacter aggregans]QGX41128.1 menaquinol oxidoreductase [Permianibacter aggregans]TDQ44561.1 quinol:cytochrome c oxidoreductase pentaheme cytochrome subunit [Permianibacter aggregans]
MAISLRAVLRPYSMLGAIVLIALAGVICGFYLSEWFFSGRAPAQPIAFSHKIHAGDHQIPCLHCHLYAEDSKVAGVPPVAKCMGCHSNIATDRPLIVALNDYWEKQEPIPWVKVHDLPDFVHFSHKRHVRAGLACNTCHGEVEQMEVLRRVSNLQMGWCIQCHQQNAVRFGTDCMTCHK